jgi:ATP-dependent Clp protease ATP-binding subunit ClpX
MGKTNSDIYRELSYIVKGHDRAKKILINLINRSYLRYYQKYGLLLEKEQLVPTHNALLIGKSGTGKTHLVKSLQKIMDFPLVIIDATSLNCVGARGGIDPEAMIKKVNEAAAVALQQNKNKYHSRDGVLNQMVVFVDEIDKLCISHDSTGRWNEYIQSSFLNIFSENPELDGVSFIFAGAFVGMLNNLKKKHIGFGKKQEEEEVEINYDEHLKRFGMIPELIGRINHIVKIDTLTESDYRSILYNLVIPKKQKELKHYGINKFSLTSEQATAIIKVAMESEQGIRNLYKEVEKLSIDLEFKSGDDNDILYLESSSEQD